MGSSAEYSVPREARDVFEYGILQNPLMSDLPVELGSLGKLVQFEGSSRPSIPINWRFAESISALKAFEASMLNSLLSRKYNVSPSNVVINTDHAPLFFMASWLARYIKDGEPRPLDHTCKDTLRLFPSEDKHGSHTSLYRKLSTNIYRTKDGRLYHTHGSLNPDPTLSALGLPLDGQPDDTYESVVQRYQDTVSQFESAALDELINEKYKQAGTIVLSSDEYFATEQGRQCEKVGLYECFKLPGSNQPPSWWPDHASFPPSPKRPLAGLKVVDLTRVIAGPAMTRGLAEMGASIMRVTSPHITDLSGFHQDLNWGKWNCHLHLEDEADREALRNLIREADVVVDGYRPGVMERHGFGRQDILDLVKDREYGIIHARVNCYGWHGPWSHRSGWQQISDACCGISASFSQAMGNTEAVTPVFPNTDFCTGIIGSSAVLHALIKRAESGGSYGVDVSLSYYCQWLIRSCGTYNEAVWKEVWTRHGSPVYRHFHAMQHLVPSMTQLLREHDAETLFRASFFETRRAEHLDTTFLVVKPISQFEDEVVDLKYHIGTRGNGIDQPVWPHDLKVEVVTERG